MPLKGFEKKSYKQLQEEAYESKRRDLAVLEANDGVWPGVKIPSHALFLWASGSELTSILEADHMPNKYIPKDLRYLHLHSFLYSLLHPLLKQLDKTQIIFSGKFEEFIHNFLQSCLLSQEHHNYVQA